MANRYWVGGAGTWDGANTTNWSASSGGSGGASVPGPNDDVFFDSASGTGICSIDASGARNAKTLTATGSIVLKRFNGSGSQVVIYGSTLSISATNLPSNPTSAEKLDFYVYANVALTINIAGSATSEIYGITIAYQASGVAVTLGSSLWAEHEVHVIGFGNSLCSFNGAGYGININSSTIGSPADVVFNNSTWNLEVINLSSISIRKAGLTTSGPIALTSTIVFTPTAPALTLIDQVGLGDIVLNLGGRTYPSLTLSWPAGGSGTPKYPTLDGGNTFGNVTITCDRSGGNPGLLLTASTTTTITGTLTLRGTSAAGTLSPVYIGVTSGVCTINCNGTSSANAVSVQNLTFGGTASPLVVNNGNNFGTNTNVSFVTSRYWVGGGGTWDTTSTTHWALSSVGTGGASVPSSTINVFFTSSSGTGTVGISSSAVALDVTAVSSPVTLSFGSVLTILGNLTILDTTCVLLTTTVFDFQAVSPKTINVNVVQPSWRFTVTSTTWTVVNSLVQFNSGAGIRLTASSTGTTCRLVGLAGQKRTLQFTGTPISSDNAFVWLGLANGGGAVENLELKFQGVDITASKRLVTCISGSTIHLVSCGVTVSGTISHSHQGQMMYIGNPSTVLDFVTFTAQAINSQYRLDLNGMGSPLNVTNLTVTPSADNFIFSTGGLLPTGTVNIQGTHRSTARVIWVNRYDTAPSAATFTLVNASFMGVKPTVAWSGTSLEDLGFNSNITFTTPVTRTASVSGLWTSEATWGSNSMPLAQDGVVINTGVNVTGSRVGPNVSTSAAAFSSLTLNTSCTLAGDMYWYGRNAKTIPANVATSSANFYFSDTLTATTGAYNLTIESDVGSLVFGYYWILRDSNPGTNYPQGLTVTVSTGGVTTRSIGGGGVSVYDQSPTRFSVVLPNCRVYNLSNYAATGTYSASISANSGITVSSGYIISQSSIATISITNLTLGNGGGTSNSTITDNGGLLSFTNLTIAKLGTLTFSGTATSAFQLGNVSKSLSGAASLVFKSGRQYNCTGWTVGGSPGNVITIGSTSTTPHTLNYTGASRVDVDYLSLSQSTATPSNTWYAGTNSTAGTGVTGWVLNSYASTQGRGLFFGSNF